MPKIVQLKDVKINNLPGLNQLSLVCVEIFNANDYSLLLYNTDAQPYRGENDSEFQIKIDNNPYIEGDLFLKVT